MLSTQTWSPPIQCVTKGGGGTVTHCMNAVHTPVLIPKWKGGSWTSEKVRGALVHKRGQKYEHELYQTSVKTIFRVWCGRPPALLPMPLLQYEYGKDGWPLHPSSDSTHAVQAVMYKCQSWAHRSYKLSEHSKVMIDLWFSEWKKMSVERWANCQKKEFANFPKRSLNLKERAFWAVRSLSDVTMLSFWGAV